MTVNIRLLGADDVETFKSIRLEALRKEPGAFASTVEDWLALSDADWLRRTVDNPVFVALESGQAVGVMGLLPERSSKTRHRATLIMVYVRQSHRGTEVADGLLRAATSHAAGLGITRIELRVNVDNARAIRFYEKRGFREIGRIPEAVIHYGKANDELMMSRAICSQRPLVQ